MREGRPAAARLHDPERSSSDLCAPKARTEMGAAPDRLGQPLCAPFVELVGPGERTGRNREVLARRLIDVKLRAGTWTVLFTDVVGSTDQRVRLGDAAVDQLLREHDAIVARALAAHAGELVKGTGDGAMCAFAGAADALAAAVAIQQRLERRNRDAPEQLRLRVGVSLGDLVFQNGDLHGLASHEAARVCASAEVGEILVTDLVRSVAGSRAGCELVARGELELKGFPAPVRVWRVAWEPAAEPERLPFPPLLEPRQTLPFSGRAGEVATVFDAWKEASGGSRQCVVVSGEPGIGKTRLVAEAARVAHGDGGVVLYGRCDDELGVPFQPFAEALDWYAARADEVVLGRWPGDLARIAPQLRDQVRNLPPPLEADAESAQYRLFDAVASWLTALGAEHPVVVVLDDLHWATRPTLLMLRHVVRATGPARLLLVLTYRETEIGPEHPLAATLAALHREPSVERIILEGLDADALGVVLEAAGYQLDTAGVELRDMLASETDGNPFFVSEVLRHLAEAGVISPGKARRGVGIGDAAVQVPPNVRDVIVERVARLGDGARQLLSVAAVIGRDFEVDVLAGAADVDELTTIDALDRASAVALVRPNAGDADRYTFVHSLIAHALLEGLSPARRSRVHARIAHALEDRHGDRAIAEVAHHVAAAVPVVEPAKAVSFARRAAEAALSAVAYDDAARHLEAVLPVAPPDRARCQMLLELADAYLRAGDVAAAQTRSHEASDLAAQLEEPSLSVAAALAYGDADARAVEHGETAEQLLRDALLLTDDQGIRVRIRATLGRSLAISGKIEEGQALSEQALAEARELEDGEALHTAFNAVLYASGTPDNIERQVAVAREFTESALGSGDLETVVHARSRLISATISVGDLDEARVLAERQRDMCRQSGQPLFRVVDLQLHALFAMGEGRFVEAEAMATEANELAVGLSGNDAPGGYGVQLFSIRREQGRLDEARPIVETVARLGQQGATWGPALAVLYTDLGMTDEAARALRHLVDDVLSGVPRDALRLGSLSYLADTCVAVGDADAAHVVYREFLPYRGLIVQLGLFLAAYGAVDRYLGALAALLGRGPEAETHFESALRTDARARMPVWLAHTELEYGRFLASRALPGDFERATALLHAALKTAQDLGIAPVAAGATAALDHVGGGPPTLVAHTNGAGISDLAPRALHPVEDGM
jgi:class 3 adenylate cyclase/tetratricopeptide (TPR) repeat protein